ncbi:Vacuolar protein sorting-associated protein 30 [Erysiphe necator]|uniref:Putative autophagy protein apg6 n=1 Tax=Uncinula necator TaxID=52586 RepID=A0A0B1P9A4_UNCNE|nr:Vacuolar protein sorting-associated protein 30 [Erysiphe necator]KHJ33935.1 putative autophagy protein apg6 [Erysiphe necator]
MQCQKCRSPLRFDSSLENLSPAAFDILVGASDNSQIKHIPPSRVPYPQDRKQFYEKAVKNASLLNTKRSLNTLQRIHNSEKSSNGKSGFASPAMSFVMLSESQIASSSATKSTEEAKQTFLRTNNADKNEALNGDGKTISQEVDRISRLFEILTARSDIDFPVCVECTDFLVKELQKRHEAATKERDAYIGFLKQLKADIPTNDEIRESREALSKAQKDEERAIAELKELEREKTEVEEDILKLEIKARALDIEEEKFWRERNDFSMKLTEFQNIRDSINLQYDHDSQVLDKLQRTNLYNDVFCISHDGNFGTINGLRLGRLSSIPVDWPEINAAWGHAVLLLQTVADRLGFKFKGYQLKPMGSTSRIVSLESTLPLNSRGSVQRKISTRQQQKTVHELFSSGDMPLGLTFMHRHFDNAMVAFLDCLRQLGAHVEEETAKDPNTRTPLALPYKIEGDKIGDVSIKLGIAQDDAWSRACKFTLTCCKFLLAHVSNINTTSRNRRIT